MYLRGLRWPWKKARSSRIIIKQTVSANMAPRNNINKNRQSAASFLSDRSPLFQPGQFTSKDLHTPFVLSMLYVLIHVSSEAKKKTKANTSVIYMDHVVSTMLLSTTQRKCKPCASEYEKRKTKTEAQKLPSPQLTLACQNI